MNIRNAIEPFLIIQILNENSANLLLRNTRQSNHAQASKDPYGVDDKNNIDGYARVCSKCDIVLDDYCRELVKVKPLGLLVEISPYETDFFITTLGGDTEMYLWFKERLMKGERGLFTIRKLNDGHPLSSIKILNGYACSYLEASVELSRFGILEISGSPL